MQIEWHFVISLGSLEFQELTLILVKEKEGRVGEVGCVLMDDSWVLREVWIKREFQARGWGTRLLKTLEPQFGQRRCFCTPPAVLANFYNRIGFRLIPQVEVPDFLRDFQTNGHIIMRRGN